MIITLYHITHDNDGKLRELSSSTCKCQIFAKRNEIEKLMMDFEKSEPMSDDNDRFQNMIYKTNLCIIWLSKKDSYALISSFSFISWHICIDQYQLSK